MNDHTIDELVATQQPRMVRLAYRMTGDYALSEDITQEVFVRLHERAGALERTRSLEGWLVTATVNAARDALRHRKSRAYIGPWLPSPLPTGDMAHEHPDSEDRLLGKEALDYELLCMFERLTPTQRATLLLRDLCGYTTKECAEALAMSSASVKTTLHRARQALGERGERLWRAPSPEVSARHMKVLGELMQALMAGDAEAVEALCVEDVQLVNDGGGEFIAALKSIRSATHVRRFLFARAPDPQTIESLDLIECNGAMAVRMKLTQKDPRRAPHIVMLYHVEEDDHGSSRIASCYMISATDKLSAME